MMEFQNWTGRQVAMDAPFESHPATTTPWASNIIGVGREDAVKLAPSGKLCNNKKADRS